jgi:CBS domain containing-hemolysin-like protein
MQPKGKVELTSSKEMSQFLGWIAMLIGTWVIASTTIDVILSYFHDSDALVLSIGLGFVFIASAVIIFGKKRPWAK